MNKEEWKSIPNYEEFYEVSSFGRVKNKLTDIILKQSTDNCGYLLLKLNKNSIKKIKRVHQLVAMAFLNHEPCGMKLVVDHINGKKDDNRLDNLQIITQRQNIQKREKTDKTKGNYSSEYVGVSWDKQSKKWRSSIKENGKLLYLGLFKSEEEASEVYQNKLKQII